MIGWIIVGVIAVLILALRYVPVRRVVLIEGVFTGRTEDTKELFQGFPLRVYYFEDYCKRCVERGYADPMNLHCNETIDLRAWRIGEEPKAGESVRLTVWMTLFFRFSIVQWTRTDWKPDPAAVAKIKEDRWKPRCGNCGRLKDGCE